MQTRGRWIGLLLATIAIALLAPSAGSAGVFPAGFTDELVAVLQQPIGLAFTPDNRLVIVTKPGLVRIYANGSLVSAPALDLSAVTCTDIERGMSGVAVDPDFADNHYIYLYYTYKKFGGCDIDNALSPVNRVSRFVLGNDNHIDPASETVLIDGIPSRSGNHNGGDLEFGHDGYLYVSTGDGGCDFRGNSGCFTVNDAARDLGGLSGKILRITSTGGIPTTNPFTGSDSDRCNVAGFTSLGRKCREIYAYGLRNPFRFDFDPNSEETRFFINDVGASRWDEIDLGGAGLDYGWNVREGPCVRDSTTNCGPPPAGMTNPIYWSGHGGGCASPTLSAFVPGNIWPDAYIGAYIYGDSVCGKFFVVRQQGAGYVASEFGSAGDPIIDGVFGPAGQTQALYYDAWTGPFPNNQIRRIVFTGSTNRAPTSHPSANPTNGDLPLDVEFDGTQSTDPDHDQLTYQWNFGDGSPTESGAQVSHTYMQEGTFTATLTVQDGHGGQSSEPIRIDAGNNAPDVAISQPSPTYKFRVGDQINLSGMAYDAEDGFLPNSSLSWRVERHHNTHTHPYLPPTQGNNVNITGPAPEDLESAGNSYLDVYLTATDSKGLSTTIARQVQPRKVDLTFETAPTGFQVEVAGDPVTAPATITSWEGWQLPVRTFNQRNPTAGGFWAFTSWSDGGAAEHSIPTPSQATTYRANFVPYRYARPATGTPLRVPLVPAYAVCQSPNSTHAAPLNYPSCTAVKLESTLLTMGRVGQGSGHIRLAVVGGDPSAAPDDADLGIAARATDVRRAGDGLDYTGSLLLRAGLRDTDTANGSYGDEPGTLFDTAFSFSVPCVPKQGIVGATCSVSTTANTLVPGYAKEGKRAILSIRSLELDDAGADGQNVPSGGSCPPTCGTGDEHAFLREGVFTP